ncbi:ladderlectin-like [Physella acuta]|uniref:ladderlectin-like n=1 Tax=Physella acuta TaxID=109671 RepID=UPI0027DB20BA|nr:ladderlectin-like [Physella acuta]
MLLFIALLLHALSGFAYTSDSGEQSMCSMFEYMGHHNGSKYFLSDFYYMNVEKALKACSSNGMYLVEVNDESEFRFVQDIARNSKTEHLLLSGSDAIKENSWVFPNNEPVKFKEWKSGNPDNYDGKEHYIIISQGNEYKMNDMPDPPTKFTRFLCERATNPDDALDQVK